ncbi:MAG: efflux RND transporter periplasmic adaptor subunit [Gemmatimonadaceae bacterium]|nr:efflux RND transporter periplasmic adaptor subunit [Gemmatimonadaceae bacterium]
MRSRTVVAIVALLVLATAGWAVARTRFEAPATAFRYVTVSRGDVHATVAATGTLSAVTTVQVGTQVSGQIAALYADYNQRVKKGQLLARLDSTLLGNAVLSADADLKKAVIAQEEAQYAYDHSKPQYEQHVMTENDFKATQFALDLAKAATQSAHAALDRARLNLSYCNIYSPIDGVVISRSVDVGQTVAASLSAPQLFLIAEDLTRMQILASVDEGDIGLIHNGEAVRFTVQAYPDATFSGTVSQVRYDSRTDNNVVEYTVVVDVPNGDRRLFPGMTATMNFSVANATNVLTVPNAALRFRGTDEMRAALAAHHDSAAPAQGGSPEAQRGRGGRGGQEGGDGQPRRTRAADIAQLWYLAPNGTPAAMLVHTGLADERATEVSGPDLHDGMQVIAGIVSSTTAAAQAPGLMMGGPQGGGGRGRGF